MKFDFKWIGGATWLLTFNGTAIACDPVLCPRGTIQDYFYFKTSRLNSPEFDNSDFENIDLWLLTHNHEDHLDNEGLKHIEKTSVIVTDKSLKKRIKRKEYPLATHLSWGEEKEFIINQFKIKIISIPAIHAKRRIFSPLIGNGNGYILVISDSKSSCRIYVTGDAVYDERIIQYTGLEHIDIVIANAGSAMIGDSILSRIIGRVTNNSNDILNLNSDLRPGNLIPVHWGTFSHYAETVKPETFRKYSNTRFLNPGETVKIQV